MVEVRLILKDKSADYLEVVLSTLQFNHDEFSQEMTMPKPPTLPETPKDKPSPARMPGTKPPP
jgi:hypothetical protein